MWAIIARFHDFSGLHRENIWLFTDAGGVSDPRKDAEHDSTEEVL